MTTFLAIFCKRIINSINVYMKFTVGDLVRHIKEKNIYGRVVKTSELGLIIKRYDYYIDIIASDWEIV